MTRFCLRINTSVKLTRLRAGEGDLFLSTRADFKGDLAGSGRGIMGSVSVSAFSSPSLLAMLSGTI